LHEPSLGTRAAYVHRVAFTGNARKSSHQEGTTQMKTKTNVKAGPMGTLIWGSK
jgi:hypothetical protein